MIRRPPIPTRTYTLLHDTTLFRAAVGFEAEAEPLVEAHGIVVLLLRVDDDVPGSPASEPAQPVEHQCRSVALALLAGGDGEALEVAARPRPAGDGVAHDLFVVVDGHPQSGGRQIGRAHV